MKLRIILCSLISLSVMASSDAAVSQASQGVYTEAQRILVHRFQNDRPTTPREPRREDVCLSDAEKNNACCSLRAEKEKRSYQLSVRWSGSYGVPPQHEVESLNKEFDGKEWDAIKKASDEKHKKAMSEYKVALMVHEKLSRLFEQGIEAAALELVAQLSAKAEKKTQE